MVNRRLMDAGKKFISQSDMAITQFLFMGFHLLMPERFGITGSPEQFEAFNHLWRVIGFMLGIDDKANCCGETLSETKSRLQAIKEDFLLPALREPNAEFENYVKICLLGISYDEPTLHYGKFSSQTCSCFSCLFFSQRFHDVHHQKNCGSAGVFLFRV